MKVFRMAWFSLIGMLVSVMPHPRLAPALLRIGGAKIGSGVRMHRVRLMNHELGLRNLHIGDGVYIGTDCLLDLAGRLLIGDRACISARSMIISHSDPNSSQKNINARSFPVSRHGVAIGADTWLGVGSIVLESAVVGDGCVVAAGSVVRGELSPDGLYAGVPVRRVRTLQRH